MKQKKSSAGELQTLLPLDQAQIRPLEWWVMFTSPRLNLGNSIACAALLLASGCPAAFASPVFATWNSASGTTASGSLDGVSFTITGLTNPRLSTSDLAIVEDYGAYTGGTSQQILAYYEESNFTVTFTSSIPVLYFYDIDFRPEDLADYDFSQPITLLAGNSTANLVGGTNLDATDTAAPLFGVVELTNVTSFTLTQNFSDPSFNFLDLAGPSAQTSAPEPGSLALATLGAAALLVRRRQSRASRSEA